MDDDANADGIAMLLGGKAALGWNKSSRLLGNKSITIDNNEVLKMILRW